MVVGAVGTATPLSEDAAGIADEEPGGTPTAAEVAFAAERAATKVAALELAATDAGAAEDAAATVVELAT